jgi:DNA-binding CsgD family transcriptional regulator
MLVGREAERSLIDSALDDARRGRTSVVVLTGEAGIGKSALLGYAGERASGMRVLATAGVESETDIPFGALHALLLPVLELLPRLPDRQASALGASLALGPAEEADRLAAFAGTLTLLGEVASAQPLLVMVDDAHWLDRASAEAIGFAARRIAGDELVILIVLREGEESSFDDRGLVRHRVPPLSSDESLTLLRERYGDDLDPGVARLIAELSGGNPLALVETPALLSAEQLSGQVPLSDPLPVAEGIQHAFLRRIEALPPELGRSLLVAAAGAGAPLEAIRAGAAAFGGSPLEPAEAAGLIALADGSVSFSHPLIRSVVYQSAAPGERRAAHRALADALSESAADTRAWHLAAAAEGPNEEVAAALEATAERAATRGSHASQARALERAADLTPDEDAAARRLHAACRAAYWAGDAAAAVRSAERALLLTTDPAIRADLIHQLAVIADFDPRHRTRGPSTELLEERAAELEETDPERSIALLGVVLQRRRMQLDVEAAHRLAMKRLELAEGVGGERHLRALQDLAWTHTFVGESEAANRLQDEVLEARRASGRLPMYASQAAETLLWLERFEELRPLLTRSIEQAREEGNVLRVAFDLTNLALLDLRLGSLTASVGAATEALTLCEAMEQTYLEACNLATLAFGSAHLGKTEECARAAGRARQLADRLADELIHADAEGALGLQALLGGRLDEAVERLAPIVALAFERNIVEPSVVPYAPDLVEVYVRAGRRDEASEILERFESNALRTGRRWAQAAALRCRGLLAADDGIDEAFTAALELHAQSPQVLERGRTELLYGGRLRRANRRRDARPHLRAALEIFDELGAAPWRELAQAELRATGESLARREPAASERLTPQELKIGMLVAEGKTNREIAEQMFLSPKTIEFHLTQVYRKLEIHSRAELAHLLGGRPDVLHAAGR